MKFTREMHASLNVASISAESVRIGDEEYRHSVALTPAAVRPDWTAKPIETLTIDDFDTLLEAGTELVVLGTGSTNVFPNRELLFAFARRGIGLEVMDSAAAARTFNVLAGEGRQVLGVLYLG